VIGPLRTRTWIAAVVALALAARVIAIVATPHFTPATDAHEYDRTAVSLVTHHRFASSTATFHGGPTAIHPPLFSVALAGVYELVGTGSDETRWTAGRAFDALLGAVAVGLISLIALRLWGPLPAFVAGVIAAVYPPLVLVGSTLMSEPMFIVLVLAAVLAALVHRASPHRLRWAVLTGVLVGLGALTRGNGVVLVIPLGFLIWNERPRGSWRALQAPLALVAAAIVTLVPWTIRNLDAFGEFVPVTTETGYIVAGTYDSVSQRLSRFPALWLPPFAQTARIDGSDPTINEAQLSDRLMTQGLRYIGDHPGSLLKTAYWNIRRMLNVSPGFERWFSSAESYPPELAVISSYAFWVLLAVALGGVLSAAVRRRARTAPAALWWCPVALLLLTIPLEESTRYRSPADPFLVLFASLALTEAAAWVRARRAVERSSPARVAAG
jgi:4-amino-4-deoxy-L-arabinose transferase-like glycosyltransferase